jgi:DNA-3-methyladenine glycosylase I
MIAYHDEEWGVPVREGRALWEMLILEGFQAGLSWSTILYRRDAFRRAFRGFDPVAVAAFGSAEVEELALDPGIIRSRTKIKATIGNARADL